MCIVRTSSDSTAKSTSWGFFSFRLTEEQWSHNGKPLNMFQVGESACTLICGRESLGTIYFCNPMDRVGVGMEGFCQLIEVNFGERVLESQDRLTLSLKR